MNIDDSFSGKNGYVFGTQMTKSIFGDDYCGEAFIYDQVYKAAFVQERLKQSGVELLFIFAPAKGSVYPEMLPDYILKTKHKKTNFETYISEGIRLKLNMIDFVQYFKILKSQTPYPLFSKYGSHWSFYGECIVIDSTIKRLEQLMRVNLPDFKYSDIRLLDTVLYRDADIFKKMEMEVPGEIYWLIRIKYFLSMIKILSRKRFWGLETVIMMHLIILGSCTRSFKMESNGIITTVSYQKMYKILKFGNWISGKKY
ncbi:MAG: hypothetical protein IPG87_10875 [Saprospiraceae bacterium]|nr:hypothetical protein [Candidatus Vicinibacter affinis]